MASLSPSPHTFIKLCIPIFLLLFTKCQTIPLKQPANALQNPTIDPSIHSSNTIKPLTATISHETHSSMLSSAHPSLQEPQSVKPIDMHHDSFTNKIRPFTRSLQSEVTNQPTLRPTEKLSTVDYLSPPLRGTETRDRYALHISPPEQKSAAVSTQESTVNRQHQRQGLVLGFNDLHKEPEKNATHSNSPSPFQSSVRSQRDQDQHQNSESKSPWPERNTMKDETIEMSTVGKYHSSQFPGHLDQNPSHDTASSLEKTRTPYVSESKGKNSIDMIKDALRKSTNFGRTMYGKIKSAVERLVSGGKSPSLPTMQEKQADGYSKEDVINLVNDIIREIQMRSNDVGDHAQMLGKTNRWDPNDLTTREQKLGLENGPLLYMRTKVLVTPETLVDAVMTSTEKLFSSKADQVPRTEMSKLMKEVKIRLAHLLTPAK